MTTPRLNAVFAALPTPVFAWESRGADLVLVDFNPAAEEQTAGLVRRLLGRRAADLYASQPHIHRALRAVLDTGAVRREETEYTRLTTGETRMLNVTYVRAEPDLVLAITEDLTERRESQRALIESELRYRTLVEGAPDGIIVHRDGRILYANDAFVEIVGAPSAEAVVGTRVLDHVHPDERSNVIARIAAIAAGGTAPLAEERLLRGDGSVVYAEIIGIPTTYDGEAAVQAIVRDVSARHRAQSLVAALSEQSLTGIAVVQDERLRYVNRRCADLFGYRPEEMIGMATEQLVAPASRELVKEMQRRRVDHGHHVHYTFTARRNDGTETDIEVFGTVTELEGRVALVSTLLDASERERLARELRQAQKMDAVGRLAGGIAHDFNNILTAIIAYTDLALSDLPPGSPVRADIDEIRLAGLRAAALTRQLLAFSRRQALEPQVVHVNEIVERMGAMLGRLIGTRITLTIEAAPAVPDVVADPSQLEQVLLNLAVNARDAMPDGGSLTIATASRRFTADDAAHHPGLKSGPYVTITVNDTGPGIPESIQPRIFEPFFTTKPAGQGTGLGLSVVYGIVKQSGGYIMLDSQEGRGTTFTVCLPTSHEPRAAGRELT